MDRLIEQHREQIKQLAAARGARRVRLFGSRALDQAGPDSDVDILIDLEQGRSALTLGGLLMVLQDLLGKRSTLLPLPRFTRKFVLKFFDKPLTSDHVPARPALY